MVRLLVPLALALSAFVCISAEKTICPENEEYSECANSACKFWDCIDALEEKKLCLCADKCVGACICKEGYVKSDRENEKCIPIDQCSKHLCPKVNEVYARCRFYETCLWKCICQEDTYRDEDGVCVSTEQSLD